MDKQPQVKLPTEVEEKLARLELLERELKATMTQKEALEVALQAQEIRSRGVEEGPDENGLYSVQIDLPPSGGWNIMIDGNPYFHGQTYKVDINKLRTLKEIMFRSWKHDSDLHGGNENAYRQPENRTYSARTGQRLH